MSSRERTPPGVRKAAVLLMSLGDRTSAEILRQLSEPELQLITQEVARIGSTSLEEAETVLHEFHQMTTSAEFAIRGGPEYAKQMLTAAFEQEAAQPDWLSRILGSSGVDFQALEKADPQQLARFIETEHPQTIALILAHLNPAPAAALLTSLSTELRSEVARRMAKLDQICPDVVGKIAGIIGQKMKALGDFPRTSYGGLREVAEVFNRLEPTLSEEIMVQIEQDDAPLVASLRQLMFVFEDLLTVDQNGMKALLGKVDRKVLTIALKGTSDELKKHFTQYMSERGAEMLREDMEALGPVRIKDVEAAQQQIIALVRELQSEGALSLGAAAADDYVT